jgi:hypothetical protein
MEDRVRSVSRFSNFPDIFNTTDERVRYISSRPELYIPVDDDVLPQVVVPLVMSHGMIPYEDINCSNDVDTISQEEFGDVLYKSVYHIQAALEGKAKPVCFDMDSALGWLQSQYLGINRTKLPIGGTIYYVNIGRTIRILTSSSFSFRPLTIDFEMTRDGQETVYALIPFIPPNYPVNSNDGNYPYDRIEVSIEQNVTRVQRHTLINELYDMYRGVPDQTTPVTLQSLGRPVRMYPENSQMGQLSSLDALCHPDLVRFRQHPDGVLTHQ